jgi:hypothetical protein
MGENSAFLKDAGLKACEQIVWLSDYAPPWKARATSITRDDQDIMTGKVSQTQSTIPLPMADNALHLIHMQKHPITTNSGRITGIVCFYYEPNTYPLNSSVPSNLTSSPKQLNRSLTYE